MDEREKNILMASVTNDTFIDFKNKFNQCTLNIQDDSFFDYDLLKAALTRKHIPITNFLLKAGCRVRNPNKIDPEETPLHLAMKLNYSIITKILKNGASIYDKNYKGETPLYAAFKRIFLKPIILHPHEGKLFFAIDAVLDYYCFKDTVQLNSSLISLNPTNEDDILHFNIACISNRVKAVKLYLKYGFDINRPFSVPSQFNGLYPLHHAATKRHIKLFECLLQHGADISIPNSMGETVLHALYHSAFCSVNNNRDMIGLIFRYGNSSKFINSIDGSGVSHFHVCCTANYPDSVQAFLDLGVDINSAVPESECDNPGSTPLHFAVSYAREKVVQLLLENGAKTDKRNKYGSTPLHLACRLSEKSASPIIKMLLDYKASASIIDKEGCTPLHIAFDYLDDDETKIFDMILSKTPRKINFSNNSGLSHFHIVSAKNYISRVEDFLVSGVSVDQKVVSGGCAHYTALHFAVLHNQIDVVEMLLKWNAQVNITINKEQLTPLHIACSYFTTTYLEIRNDQVEYFDWTSKHKNRLEIIKLLLLYGADVNAQDSLGRAPLHYTCMADELSPYVSSESEYWDPKQVNTVLKEIIQILLSNKVNINTRTDSKKSILHFISENVVLDNAEELLEFCINEGADIHATDIDGFTPLHIAAKTRKVLCVEFFLKHKANVNAKSKDLKIPLNFVLENFVGYSRWEKETFLLLLEYGSDVNLRHKNNRILWIDALENCNCFAIKNLLNYGADINVEDSLGNPLIVSVLSKWKNHTDDWITKVDAFQIIFEHLQMLLAAGFYVNDNVQKCCYKLRQYYRSLLNESFYLAKFCNILKSCEEVLGRMKLVKIDNYTSLYSILFKSTHELSKHVNNATLVNILENEKTCANFSYYSCLLKAKFKKALIRNDVLQSANAALFSVIGTNLPDLCYDLILKHLANEEISNLKVAASNRVIYKEKINNNFSSMEPPRKMQKKE